MRVLLIADWMPRPGGSETYVLAVRDGLRAAGDDVRVLASSAGTAVDGTADYVAYGTTHPVPQALLQIVNPSALRTLSTALREHRPDVVFVTLFMYHLSAALLGRLRGMPTVLSVLDYKYICPLGSKVLPEGHRCTERAGAACLRHHCVSVPHWLRDLPRYALVRSAMRQVDRVLACSRWVQRELEVNGIGAEHLPLPVATPAPSFGRHPTPEPLFVYCGRLAAEKGVALLLRAFARVHRELPTARLRIVGEGPERGDLERLAGELGLERAVTFRGWVPAAAVERELADAWALVTPSLWAEPLGLAAREAIVRGVPVVASRDGGLGETIEEGVTGLVFPNGDQTALGERLEAVARGREFPEHMLSQDSVSLARASWDVHHHGEALHRVFEDVVARRRGTMRALPNVAAGSAPP
jgi:glycosyltransferase involved in cell wall biosynthesis